MRIIKQIEIEGKTATALFDTGAWHTWVCSELISEVVKTTIREPYSVSIGGKTVDVKEICIINGEIEGLGFDTEVIPINELGKADGYELDAIIGALTMEKWEIKLDPKNGKLDLEGLRRREFTEFIEQIKKWWKK